ncbi:hypothetical protein [Longimicrobium terrae]|uniref:Uncharacterized protein n=1 Tax=Longimicrobium terrae TaxID=1639882 RepID=A0A841H680_9BACT|nr:hypothetical protein [Longimicrobium terrae]MBB4639329.1 hypothetical protein [Longimicrobium terrae]MBB6073600.1 hypothetical protein [Longimicrobium terrae]NNC29393.1 hypothetical protein [Longimicrobium terrae]
MRTLLTFLLLVCFGTTQAAAVDCPMAPAPAGQDASAPHHASHHAGHGAAHTHPDAPSSNHDHHPLQHASTGCGIAMSCGVSALPAAHALALSHGTASAARAAVARSEYASHHPATEPPPPRHPSA